MERLALLAWVAQDAQSMQALEQRQGYSIGPRTPPIHQDRGLPQQGILS